jgi:hypothetical protein
MSLPAVCPSGLAGTVRGMRVKEERILADRQLAKAGGQVDALLAACWLATTDAGPYALGDAPIDWGKVLVGDRAHVLFQIRIATYGADYAFRVTCERDACREPIDWQIDLAALPMRPLPEASRVGFVAGNKLETQLPDGTRVTYRLLTGADERALPALRRQAPDRIVSTLLAHRIVAIEGVSPKDRRAFLEDLPMRDATELMRELDQADGGLETQIDIACPACGQEQSLALPFGRDFLLPTSTTSRTSGPSPRSLGSTSTSGAR